MAVDFAGLLTDLGGESNALQGVLSVLRDAQWNQSTPAAGWAIRDQVSHLAYFDDVACLALTDADAFHQEAERLRAKGPHFPDVVAEEVRSMPHEELHAWFKASRAKLLHTLDGDDPQRRIPWFGPSMSVASSATARLMETWAHGQDIYDTLGLSHPHACGLKNIAHLGITTFGWAFSLNGVPVPDESVRVELFAYDSGVPWVWGPAEALNRVTGPAEDFVLAVTQRRHWTDTALVVEGPVATQWMSIAQAFAGEPGKGRAPRASAP